MSRSVWIVLLLLLIWLILGAFFWNAVPFWKTSSSNNGPCVVSWELKDGKSVVAESDATINFAKATANMQKLDANLVEAINTVSNYLKKNTSKIVTIIGYFDKDEKISSGTHRELALARAASVKAMLTKKGVAESQLKTVPMQYDDKKSNSDCIDGNVLNRGASFHMGLMK